MEDKSLTFWGHLEELRWVLFRTIFAVFVLAIVGFYFMPYIFDQVILSPARSDFFMYEWFCKVSSRFSLLPDFCNQDFQVTIININLATQFLTHISTSFYLAVMFAFPYLIFEIWRFVSPALYDNEKRNVRGAFIFGSMMFLIGCGVGYTLVFPMTLRFLADYQISELITNQISMNSYMNNFFMLVFVMGIVFELPVISLLLSKLGLVSKTFFRKYRKYAIVILLILSAVITPSGDPFTLMVVFLPIYMLYELSCFIVRDEAKEVENV